jgi:predicted MPP superfamily phosphohydrolase
MFEYGMRDHSLLYVAIMLATLAAVIKLVYALRTQLWAYFAAFLIYAAIMVVAAIELRMDGFNVLKLLCYAVFGGGFVLCCSLAWLSRTKFKVVSVFFALLGLALVPIVVDAFLIEPHQLECRDVYLTSSKIKSPLSIAVVSDLQTDRVGSFERTCLQYVINRKPDLILLPGDYIQIDEWSVRREQMGRLRTIFKDLNFSAPFGVYAVRGNVEYDEWTNIFDNLPVRTFPSTGRVIGEGITISGLSLDDSFDKLLKVDPVAPFHIVFGHGPDFALGSVDADLLVAGHTHGGQVALPLIGPVMTLSRIPKSWVSQGIQQLDTDSVLVLSRGIGMERRYAPRLRFGCRPEVVFIHISPGGAGTKFLRQEIRSVI